MSFRSLVAVVLSALATVAGAGAQSVRVYISYPGQPNGVQPAPVLAFSAGPQPSPLTLVVDESQRFQTMDGFGASLTEGSAWLLEKVVPAATRDRIMTELFDPKLGVGLSFLRQPIGSTDLSRSHYTFDDMPAGVSDPTLAHFSTARYDDYVFPIIREALRLNPAITVMATPWSPPAWMKTRPTTYGGQLRPDAMPAYAAYLVKSVEAFQQAGVPVKYLSVQNEPLNETHNYPGTLLPAAQAARLIGDDLGPELRRAGLQTEILAYDHNWDHPEYPETVLADPVAAPYVAGSALHCYGGDPSAQEGIHERFPEKGIWLTECSGGTWQTEDPLRSTAHLVIRATRHWAKSVVLWTVVLDTEHNPHAGGCGTCRGLVTVDLHTSPIGVVYNGDLWGLGQASRFVLPGAVRIASTSPGADSLESVAFQNADGSIALLVINNRTEATPFALAWHGRSVATTLAAGAVATYTWR